MLRPNIILIVLDTMRQSTLYSQLEKTVSFRMLAQDGVVYDQVIAPSPWTVPSHVSMFTGKYASEHGVHRHQDEPGIEIFTRIKKLKKMLPEIVHERGYNTISLHANNFISAASGFGKGYDVSLNTGPFAEIERVRLKIKEEVGEIPGQTGKEKAIGLIKSGRLGVPVKLMRYNAALNKYLDKLNFPSGKGADEIIEQFTGSTINDPFFAFMNFMEAHEPYNRGAPRSSLTAIDDDSKRASRDLFGIQNLSKETIEASRKGYENSVIILDKELLKLLDFLKDKSLYENTLIIITSDHGQDLREKKFIGHDKFLFDELTRVPLIIKYPENRKFEIAHGYQSLVSMYNFILSWSEGKELAYPSEPEVYSESHGYSKGEIERLTDGKLIDSPFNVQLKAIYTDSYKLVIDGTNGKIEEFLVDGKETEPGDHKELITELMTHLEIFSGSADFKFPSF